MVHRVKKLLGIPTVESTCISICMIEDNGIEDMCIGCGRTMTEITEFYNADDCRRIEINRLALNRLQNDS